MINNDYLTFSDKTILIVYFNILSIQFNFPNKDLKFNIQGDSGHLDIKCMMFIAQEVYC